MSDTLRARLAALEALVGVLGWGSGGRATELKVALLAAIAADEVARKPWPVAGVVVGTDGLGTPASPVAPAAAAPETPLPDVDDRDALSFASRELEDIADKHRARGHAAIAASYERHADALRKIRGFSSLPASPAGPSEDTALLDVAQRLLYGADFEYQNPDGGDVGFPVVLLELPQGARVGGNFRAFLRSASNALSSLPSREPAATPPENAT